jgi:MFS family permease
MAIVAEADRPGVLLRVRRISRPLATRDFRLVWLGQTVSALGGPFQMVALTWLVLNLTGSALALSSTLLAAALPASALLLVGGVISDRYDPRTVMIWSDAGRAIITGLIAVLNICAKIGAKEALCTRRSPSRYSTPRAPSSLRERPRGAVRRRG